jgi:hypothetical protein
VLVTLVEGLELTLIPLLSAATLVKSGRWCGLRVRILQEVKR